jgi:hypothetical protein
MKSILFLGPDKTAIICGLIPAATYLVQTIRLEKPNGFTLFLNILTGFFIAFPYLGKALRRKYINKG